MKPNVRNGDIVEVAPISAGEPQRGDIVLARGRGGFRLHRVVGRDAATGKIVTRGDAGQQNDDPAEMVLGKVVSIERNERRISLTAPGTKLWHAVRTQSRRVLLAVAHRAPRARSVVAPFVFLVLALFLSAAPAAAQADLQTTVDTAAAPTTIAAGGQITYTITVINNGPNTATTPSVTDTTPANTTFVSMAMTGGTGTWNCTNPAVGATGLSTCTRSTNMANARTATFTYVVQINPGTLAGTTITNSANISSTTTDPTPGNNTLVSNIVTVGATPDLSVTETVAPNPVATGANITYTETVTNNSTTIAAIGATLTQSTPAQTLFVSATPPAGWTCGTTPAVGATGAIICTANGNFNASTSVNFTVVVSVSPEATVGSAIANSVTVSETGTDPNPANNTATASVTVQGADLSMTQAASKPAVAPGTTIMYTETVTNNGPNAATTAVLYQQTPPNTTFASIAAPTGWTCTSPAVGGTGQILCTDGTALASGTTTTAFTFDVTVNSGGAAPAAGTTIVNSADVTSQTTDPVSTNNATSTSVLVETTGDSDLAVYMTASPTPVFISSAISYTIQVTNLGLASAASVTLTDTLPATLTNASATTSAGSCGAPAGGVITCALGAVAYPLGTPITITVTGTTPAAAITMTNVATVSITGTDPVSSNNTVTLLTVVQPLVCATPGKDGPGGTLTGVVNAYYPPGAGVGTVSAGATSVLLGAAAAAPGALTAIASGDLVLIIQMQDATINSTNSGVYGDGVPGDPGYGATSLASSGLFEFVTATSAVPVTGGTLTFTGTGATGGLLNSYVNAAAAPATNPTAGQATFQVIRVPQYTSATLNSGLTALAWNGKTGGVLALDIASQLTLGGTVAVDAEGFRGGAGQNYTAATTPPTPLSTDYVTLSTQTTNASKGEGIAGTPKYIANATLTAATNTANEGYPKGSFARGAPGNAGGGATDADPTANDQNDGGGGGANGGNGGNGGFAWNSAGLVGGFGGQAFPATTSAILMGGGGGAGTTNNGSFWDPSTDTGGSTSNTCPTPCTGINSSGTAGGGIVIIHTGSVVGTGAITSNGQAALQTENDGGGGGGAGGTVLVFANSGNLAGLTASAVGGNGGITWPESAPGAFPGNRHGPGAGGGGGVIFTSSGPGTANVSGGIPGWTTLANDPYGATTGQSGVAAIALAITETPGTQSGAYCAGADLAVTNAGTPNPVIPGNNITYIQTVTNNGPLDAINGTFSEAVPSNTTYQSLVRAPGWSCTTPAVGASGNIGCTNPDVANGAVGTFTLVVQVSPATVSGTQITDTDSVSSGSSDPNLANNTATVVTLVAAANTANIVVTNSASPNPVQAGNNITYVITVTNQGPSAATTVTFNDTVPTNTTFFSFAQSGTVWSCPSPGSGGKVTCTIGTLAPGATSTLTLVVNVASGTASGTVISDTASTSTATPDSNPSSNSATANVTVASAGQYDLSITKTGSPNPVTPGNNITYLLKFANNGPNSASNVTYTDTVPANTTFVSLAIPAGATCPTVPAVGGTGAISCCPGSGGVCSGAAVPSGTSAQFSLVVKVNSGTAAGTTITNTAMIAPTTNDVTVANNSSTATTIVASPSQADVAIVKTASPEPVDQGATLTYTLQVTNNGPAVAQGVAVSDPLPGEVTFVSVSTTQGTCSQSAGTVSCSLGSVSVGGLVIITINTTAVTFSSSSLAANTATVGATTSDPNPSNNFSSTLSTIQAATAVQLASFQAHAIVGGGVLLEWRTREEIRNLGFHVYREDAQGQHRLDPSLIAGGALFLRGAQPPHTAKTYQWVDPDGGPGSSYVLEDVDLSGERTTHGPVSAESTITVAAPVAQAVLLNHLEKSLASPASSLATPWQPSAPSVALPRPVPPLGPHNPVMPSEMTSAYLDGLPAAKISVNAEGWYVVTRAQLAAAGFDPGNDTRTLQLFAEGVEQPIAIIGQGHGPFAAGGSIAFYGTGIDTPFSGTRVYWLIRGSQAGKRIPVSALQGSGASGLGSFLSAVTLEQRTTYFAALLNGVDADNFFGAPVNTDPVDQDLVVNHYDATSSIAAQLAVTLQGATTGQAHSVSVALNGSAVGVMNFNDQANYTSTFPVEQGMIHEGTNTVTLTALNGDNDISLVQSITLQYPHSYTADANWLQATAPAGENLKITGFTNSQIQVYDITDPLNIVQLTGSVNLDNSVWGITVTVPGSGGAAQRTLLAFSADQISSPSAIAYHAPSTLLAQREGAQSIIITHPEFVASAAPLVSLRKSQQQDVALVTVDQLFDAFNYGERSPFALRAYLYFATSEWREKPQSVLLLGDASLDPRGYLGLGDFDFVPTRIIETGAFKTSSDDWLTDFQETGFATIATGRIPARTAAEAALVVSKIVNYEQGGSAGSWTHQALVIADQNIGVDFSNEAELANALLPPSVVTTTILADGQAPNVVSQQILDAVNSGALLVNYTGHGSEEQWSFADLLDDTSAGALTNGGRLPVFLLMDCLNGFFHDVYATSLSTSLLMAPNGGAVAVWASSGFTTAPPQASMDQALLRTLAANPSLPLGQAILKAKSNITDPDVRRTWILFGDPAMVVAFPNTPAAHHKR
ncbi:MAG: C25 family cysteine peptidase [Candidatus Acidiferrales bacterium]